MSYTHTVKEGEAVRLDDIDPGETADLSKAEGETRIEALGAELSEQQDLLFAAGRNGLLLVLQGRDTSGKDGLIRHLVRYLNAQSCQVIPFKEPTPVDLAHDFLWRIHPCAPARGRTAIFNRSHYEDVLVVRVHNLVPEAVWKRRYDRINHFESLLLDADTIVLKFFLHIDKSEQEERLLDREKDPTKAWKLAVGDWQERELWDAYTKAYEAALSRCNPPDAPWHVVPANHKWFRDLAVTDVIVKTLRPYREPWMETLEKIGETAKRDLEAYRAEHR